jgi:hypothetical protein
MFLGVGGQADPGNMRFALLRWRKVEQMKKATVVVVVVVLITAWVGFNPIGRFGFCRFGLLVYSAIPFPAVDLVIHTNGWPAIRGSKAHFVGFSEIEGLLEERPDVLIIGTGYDNMVQVDGEILAMCAVQVLPLPTPEAVRRYNELKGEGKRVVAIIHSTC